MELSLDKSQLCDIQGRLFILANKEGYSSAEFIDSFMNGDASNKLISSITEYINASKDDVEIHIIGRYIDACVLAICFQLWDAGINFKILIDYCFTTAKDFSRADIIKIMKRNFGRCVVGTIT